MIRRAKETYFDLERKLKEIIFINFLRDKNK